MNGVASSCHILSNSPALHSLKRQQLVQLCKRNGIKASGKNADIVEKLKAHALNHVLDPSSLTQQPFSSDDDHEKENRRIVMPRPSDQWTVIEEDSREVARVHLGLKGIREDVEHEMSTISPMKGFGTSNRSAEFGTGTTSSKGSMSSSFKAVASTLKRGRSKLSTVPTPGNRPTMHTKEPAIKDSLAATSIPYDAHPPTYPQLPEPEPLDADDSRDQSMLGLGASTVRLVTTALAAPSPPALRPFTPTFEPSHSPGSPYIPSIYPRLPSTDPVLPGGFPQSFSTPSTQPASSAGSRPPTQPFLFGSPAHKISNTQFHSAAASVLAEMNSRLGLTGTPDAVGLNLLQSRPAPVAGPVLQDKPCTDVTSKFNRAHEREFERMEGLGAWYAKRNAASPASDAGKKRKSDVLGGAPRRPLGPSNARGRRTSRAMTPGTRRSLIAATEVEEAEGTRAKRVRISIVEAKRAQVAADAGDSDGDDMDVDQDANGERERERAAIKKKLEISRARRRSSMGRVSVGGGKPPLIPNQPKKGMATKFGFLSAAKTLVKNVWNKGVGTSNTQVPKPTTSTIPPPKSSHGGTGAASRKPTPNVLIKPSSAIKSSAAKPTPARTSTTKPDPDTSLRVPTTGLGMGRQASMRSGTSSALGTRSSAASVVGRSSTVSSVATSTVAAARRGAIPSFQQPAGRIPRTSSLVNGSGTTGSRTSAGGTTSSRSGGAAVSSIGMRKAGFVPTPVGDAGTASTSSIRRKRTSSTLFAPTASSLARMQSTVRPPSLTSVASNLNAVGPDGRALAKVLEQRSTSPSGMPTVMSPPLVGGVTMPSRGPGTIFASGTPSFASTQAPAAVTACSDLELSPKARPLPVRRPRISRSRVIAKLGAQRAASGSSMSSTASKRRSLNTPKTRGSLGVRVSGIGAKAGGREAAAAALSARRRLRQSEVLRRRSRVGGLESARERTPENWEGQSEGDDGTHGELEAPMED